MIVYRGVPITGFFLPECVESACKYNPAPDDLFIVTYAKCGTTWMQHIVYLIQNHGVPPASAGEFYRSSPFIELMGAECIEGMTRPGAIKTHLPFHLVPFSEDAKYIVVIRNPRDVIVSLHYHWQMFPGYHYCGSFDDSFETFMGGEADSGDYFKFYRDWYAEKARHNILFVVYEQLKRDPERVVLDIAEFMGSEYKEALLDNDKAVLKNVLKFSHVDEMKKYANGNFQEFFGAELDGSVSKGLKAFHDSIRDAGPDAAKKITYVRKGIVGDWSNHFSKDQLDLLNEKFTLEASATDLAELWPELKFIKP